MSKDVGGLIRLTSGSIGAGKSYINVKNADDEHKKKRYNKIYSNIRGHSELAEGITPLPDDWRDCEEYSLIIIDEVQFNEKFSRHFSSRRDQEVVDVTMIRHRHCDLWLITPNTKLLNPDIRLLVNEHWVLEINGKKTCKAFKFHDAQTSVTKSSKNKAFDEETFEIKEPYQSMYKTTEDGVASGRAHHFNIKLAGFILGMIIICCGIGLLAMFLINKSSGDAQKLDQNEKQAVQQAQKNSKLDQVTITSPEIECRKGINVEKPECVEYFNNLTENKMSVGDNNSDFEYDPSKPFEQESIQQSVKYEVTAKPVFSGCMKQHGRYVGYTQQGSILHDISQSDCAKLMSGDRPFNYFAKDAPPPQPVTNTESEESVMYKKALMENMARIEAEKIIASRTAEVKAEPFPVGHVPSQYMDSAQRF